MISREQASLYVCDKESMLVAMQRKGWLMPKKNQPICTLKFMEGVRKGEIWCPKVSDVTKAVVVVTPPPQEMIAQEIVSALQRVAASQIAVNPNFDSNPLQSLAELIQKKKADKQWLLQLLYVLDNNHGVFAPNFVYVKPRKPHQVDPQMVDNQDSFFDGLPQITSKKSKRNTAFSIRKTERQEQKLRNLEKRVQEAQEKLDRERFEQRVNHEDGAQQNEQQQQEEVKSHRQGNEQHQLNMIHESQSQRAIRTGNNIADLPDMQVDQQPNSQVNMASPGNLTVLQEVYQNIQPEINQPVTEFGQEQDELYKASAARSILARRNRNKKLKNQQRQQQQQTMGRENIIGNAVDFNPNDDDEPIE